LLYSYYYDHAMGWMVPIRFLPGTGKGSFFLFVSASRPVWRPAQRCLFKHRDNFTFTIKQPFRVTNLSWICRFILGA